MDNLPILHLEDIGIKRGTFPKEILKALRKGTPAVIVKDPENDRKIQIHYLDQIT